MRKERRVGANAACGGISQCGGTMMILHCPAQSQQQSLLSQTRSILAANCLGQPYKP